MLPGHGLDCPHAIGGGRQACSPPLASHLEGGVDLDQLVIDAALEVQRAIERPIIAEHRPGTCNVPFPPFREPVGILPGARLRAPDPLVYINHSRGHCCYGDLRKTSVESRSHGAGRAREPRRPGIMVAFSPQRPIVIGRAGGPSRAPGRDVAARALQVQFEMGHSGGPSSSAAGPGRSSNWRAGRGEGHPAAETTPHGGSEPGWTIPSPAATARPRSSAWRPPRPRRRARCSAPRCCVGRAAATARSAAVCRRRVPATPAS